VIEVSDLIGKPFQYGGRGPAEYDCYGLVMECARRAGAPIPDHHSTDNQAAQAAAFAMARTGEHWPELPGPEPDCVVLFRIDRRAGTHVGWMLDPSQFIHTMAQINGVAVERVDSPMWERRVLGFYRYKRN
jgi:cell wall-associated NlpC family hydrolase